MFPAILAALLTTLVSVPPSRSQPAIAGEADFSAAIFDTLGSGHWQAALTMLREFNRRFPGDPDMLYNQACLENRSGDTDQAHKTLKNALDAGFAEMGSALQDPDMQGVADDPALFTVVPAVRDSLLRQSMGRATMLDFQIWSDPMDLDTGDPSAAPCRVRFRWMPAGLRVEITAAEPWDDFTLSDLPPWNGGAGIVVNLVVPDSAASFSGSNGFSFACGFEKGATATALYLTRQNLWQRLTDMDPKTKSDPQGGVVYAVTLLWPVIAPFHPLSDPVLGINVQVRRRADFRFAEAALMPDPWAWAPNAARHRYAPLRFNRSSLNEAAIMGRLPDSISGSDPLKLSLTVISPSAGEGRLSVAFNDQAGQPVLRDEANSQTVVLSQGVNALSRLVDFSPLATGPYLLRVGIRFPSGKESVWATSVLRIVPGWLDGVQEQIDRLPAAEQPTLRYIRNAVEEALAQHRPRSNPGPASKTIRDIQAMLRQAAATGSIMPDQGSVSLVYPGPAKQPRLCTLYLTPDSTGTRRPLPVLVLHRAKSREGFLIDRIARNVEFGKLVPSGAGDPRPIYVVPHPASAPSCAEEDAEEGRACLAWCLEFLGADRADVVGIDATGSAALRLAAAEPPRVSRTLLFAGRQLQPWSGTGDPDWESLLKPPPTGPVTWIDFPDESGSVGQGTRLLALLRKNGWRVSESTAQGGLSLSQAADRLVRWTVAPDSTR
ncbi:hypothetical protein CO151_12575 [bacterium CG_4_9_14_3_um_filter_65_15]|nr:MAG: hypothetical protein CO151_12575 [bacterium CG_4_9_14_3_um_filter_65_15]